MAKTAAEMLDRMEALVREMSLNEMVAGRPAAENPHYCEARAIVAELPEPIDPDVLEARQIIADTYGNRSGDGIIPERVRAIVKGKGDEYYEMHAVVAALKRGR